MGSGEVIDTNHDGNAQLEFAQPGSPIEMLIAWACGEK
jgi:hypothetical protein